MPEAVCLPLAYEMLPGNTTDKTTLTTMIALLKKRHGTIGRIWVMDGGIPTEDSLAQMRAGASARLVTVEVTATGELTYRLDRAKLRTTRRREGRYLLRTNLVDYNPDDLWRYYMQLVFVEEVFRTLKGDLGLRPIFHQKPGRIEAHLFVAFLAYCLSITLHQQLRKLSGGLMPRTVLEKLATSQLLDVRVRTTDGRELLLVRRTEPDQAVKLLLQQLGRTLPAQPPPKISASAILM
jgi:transposase